MKVLELFSGSGNLSRAFQAKGHTVLSVDIRRRKGVCEPTLRKDVLDLTARYLTCTFDIVWASPPCDIWSYAAGGSHWTPDGLPKTKKSLVHLHILERTLAIIDELRPAYFFIENPRGRLRNYPRLTSWLKDRGGIVKTLTLSSYGFPTTKPTNIFTNALDWQPKELDRFGRGAKTSGTFDNLTRCQRQATPRALADELVVFCERALSAQNGVKI